MQRQRDQLQQESDRFREEEERQLLALQEQQENLVQNQLQDQINQQILLNAQLQEQQKQLLILQQQQQNLIGGANIITTVPIAVQPTQPALGSTTIDSNSESNKPSTSVTDDADAVVIENTSLTKSSGDAEEQAADAQTDDTRSNENNGESQTA